jgi:hypothetical protein
MVLVGAVSTSYMQKPMRMNNIKTMVNQYYNSVKAPMSLPWPASL